MPAEPWEWGNPVRKSDLTGRWRPRYQKWWRGGGYVVQVEVEDTHFSMFDEKQEKPTAIRFKWRDATDIDLMHLAAKLGPDFGRTPPAEAATRAA